jgi:membrane protease YdiL (CAAX protease family)
MTLPALAGVVAVLLAANVVGNLRTPEPWYVPFNLAVTAVLVALARAGGVPAAELGLARPGVEAGLGVGAAGAMVVAAGGVAIALLPRTRPLLADRRMAGVGGRETAYRALVRIPLGTVVLEEVAFRGVLLALLARLASLGWAVAASSVLFGLWHVLPTMAALDVNGIARSRSARTVAVMAAVAFTAVVGATFCWLRWSTGSLLAPVLAHAAANATATVAAFFVLRTRCAAAAADCRDVFVE